jgi:hypothetical protein
MLAVPSGIWYEQSMFRKEIGAETCREESVDEVNFKYDFCC